MWKLKWNIGDKHFTHASISTYITLIIITNRKSLFRYFASKYCYCFKLYCLQMLSFWLELKILKIHFRVSSDAKSSTIESRLKLKHWTASKINVRIPLGNAFSHRHLNNLVTNKGTAQHTHTHTLSTQINKCGTRPRSFLSALSFTFHWI